MFQRDVLGMLVACSNQHEAGIDMERVLSYPLAPVSIALGTPDGAIRKTIKTNLFDIAVLTPDEMPPPNQLTFFFLDLAAPIRSIVGNGEAIGDLAWNILIKDTSTIHNDFHSL